VTLFCLPIGGFWIFLDGHQYAEARSDYVAIVHGYPGLSGFGLPKDLWVYSLPLRSLTEGVLDGKGRSKARPATLSPDQVILDILKPEAKARVAVWRGQLPFARHLLIEDPNHRDIVETDAADLLPRLVQPSDEPWLESAIIRSEPAVSQVYVRGLREINSELAASALQRSALNHEVARQLDLLADWEGRCGPQLQAWIEAFLADKGSRIFLPAIAQTVLRTGCKLPLAAALIADPSGVQSALYAMRIADENTLTTIQGMINDSLEAVERGTVQLKPNVAARLATYAHHLGKAACTPRLLGAVPEAEFISRLDAGIAIGRDCAGAHLVAAVETDRISLVLRRDGSADEPVVVLVLSPELGAEALPFMDALIESGTDHRQTVFRAILTATKNSDVRLGAARRLRQEGSRRDDALGFVLEGADDLTKELLRWLANYNSEQASTYLASTAQTRA
jgi:hypothetical protein